MAAKIHHVVHQINWEGADLSQPSWCSIASWRRFAAKHDWRHRLWPTKELQQQFEPNVWSWMSRQTQRGLKSLVASYQILHRHGGIVIDTNLIWLGAMLARDRNHPPTSYLLRLASERNAFVLAALPDAEPDVAFALEASLLAAAPGIAAVERALDAVGEFARDDGGAALSLSQAESIAPAAMRRARASVLPAHALFYALVNRSDGVMPRFPAMSSVGMHHLAWVQPPAWVQGGVPARYATAGALANGNGAKDVPDPTGVSQCYRDARGWRLVHPPGATAPSAVGRITWRKNVSYVMQWPNKAEHLARLNAQNKTWLAARLERPHLLRHDPRHDALAPFAAHDARPVAKHDARRGTPKPTLPSSSAAWKSSLHAAGPRAP